MKVCMMAVDHEIFSRKYRLYGEILYMDVVGSPQSIIKHVIYN